MKLTEGQGPAESKEVFPEYGHIRCGASFKRQEDASLAPIRTPNSWLQFNRHIRFSPHLQLENAFKTLKPDSSVTATISIITSGSLLSTFLLNYLAQIATSEAEVLNVVGKSAAIAGTLLGLNYLLKIDDGKQKRLTHR